MKNQDLMNKASNLTIGVTTVAFSKNNILLDQISSLGFKLVKPNPYLRRLTPKELISFLSDCDGAIIGLDQINSSVLSHLPNLKFISKYGVGLDNIDQIACKESNCLVLHQKGINKRSVSEMALGFMLGLQRNLYESSNDLKTGRWIKNGGMQLTGKTIGIIGLGNIGKDLANLIKPFNCKILVNDLLDQEEYCRTNGFLQVDLDQLIETSDIISIHTPLTEKTKNLFDATMFSKMKKGSILINTARGQIINLNDLKTALLTGKLKGAALDVYDEEPPADKELIGLPNLINTPHIGGNSTEAVIAMGEASISNIQSILIH